MAAKNLEIKVGVTVTAALLVLVLSLIWGGGGGLFDSRQRVRAAFANARGLAVGDPVLVRGVKQGAVESITLAPTHVEVVFRVREELPLFSDMTVSIEDRELMGGRQLHLVPGNSGRPASADQIIEGRADSGMMIMLQRAEATLLMADSVLAVFRSILDQDAVRRLPEKLEGAVSGITAVVRENRESLRRTAEHLEEFSSAVIADSLSSRSREMISRFDSLAVSLDSTAVLTRRVLLQLHDPRGTAGSLLHEKELYTRLLHTAVSLDSLVADIRRDPKKYMKISIF